MARIESIAVGGYYPTPHHLVGLIASRIGAAPLPPDDEDGGERTFVLVDPCAGEGAAVLDVAGRLGGKHVRLYAAEMERSRGRTLERDACKLLGSGRATVTHGDAFGIRFRKASASGDHGGASLLWLNPPYDDDREHGRLEERFLARFATALAPSGVLVFVVPCHALAASAATLAREFSGLHCVRFPGADFAAFRQVVVLATKRATLLEPSPAVVQQVLRWATDPDAIPALAEGPPLATMPHFDEERGGFGVWEHRACDVMAVLKELKPWHRTGKDGVATAQEEILPSLPASDLLTRRYTLAMPPRPAHIAAGIAAGIFNGARVESDQAGLAPLLIKGVFDRAFRTVEHKHNRDGDLVGLVQVQRPQLVTTVLDLSTHRYHTIAPSAERTGSTELATMTAADLLDHYGPALMDVMLRQCPVLHDPAHAAQRFALPDLPRKLYSAQETAVRVAITLLGGQACKSRRGKAAFLLGEVGSGKTSCALATFHALGGKRLLVLCPPHLLAGWADQVRAVLPWARTLVLEDLADVERLAADGSEGPVVAILSREAAKLGHGWQSVGALCPACGAPTPDEDLATRRARCEAKTLRPTNPRGDLAVDLAWAMARAFPTSPEVRQLLQGRMPRRHLEAMASDQPSTERAWQRLCRELDGLVDRMVCLVEDVRSLALEATMLALVADPVPARIVSVARALWQRAIADTSAYGQGAQLRGAARNVLMLLPAKSEVQAEAIAQLRSDDREPRTYRVDPWDELGRRVEQAASGQFYLGSHLRIDAEGPHYAGEGAGPQAAMVACLAKLTEGSFAWSSSCGEPLFQASAAPRRLPLATYIAQKHPRLFDLLVLDEGHEYSAEDSAQSHAAMRLTNLRVPTLVLTGSVMNGYAHSLFNLLWALSPAFRAEFGREERRAFVDRYGYRKQLVEQRDVNTRKVVTYGAMSDRVETHARTIGDAPGVLPLLLFKHLLPLSITLHKADLAVDLPKCVERSVPIDPTPELRSAYQRLESALFARIRKDQFSEMAGKLWGQVAELPGFLDRATEDTGNAEGGAYEVRYPKACGGQLVARAAPLPKKTILPKERWMLDTVEAELGEGRNVLVFGWHVHVLPRLARLIEWELGVPCPVLNADKVSAAKRQAWIDHEVIGKGQRVLVVNPVAVQTGLNNLVHFSTELWMANPGCSPTTYRQAVGRIDRVNQTKETRVFFPFYVGTAQQTMHQLLLAKIAVSLATDGLDAESAIAAAGVGDSELVGFAVGRQLFEMICRRRQS